MFLVVMATCWWCTFVVISRFVNVSISYSCSSNIYCIRVYSVWDVTVYVSRSDNNMLNVVCHFLPMSCVSWDQMKPLNIYSLCLLVKHSTNVTLLIDRQAELHATAGKPVYMNLPTLNTSLRWNYHSFCATYKTWLKIYSVKNAVSLK